MFQVHLFVQTALLPALFLAEALYSISPLTICKIWKFYCSLLPIPLTWFFCVEHCQMLSGNQSRLYLNSFSSCCSSMAFVIIHLSLHTLLPRWHPFCSAGSQFGSFRCVDTLLAIIPISLVVVMTHITGLHFLISLLTSDFGNKYLLLWLASQVSSPVLFFDVCVWIVGNTFNQ